MSISSIMREKGFNKSKQLLILNSVQKQKATNLCNINSTFVSPIYTFSLAANIFIYTPIQGTNREKCFNHIIYKGKMPSLAGKKHISVHFLFHKQRVFHLSTEKVRVRSVENGTQSGYSRVDTRNNDINKRSKKFPSGENAKIKWKNILKYGKIKFIIAKKVHVYMLYQLNLLLGTN